MVKFDSTTAQGLAGSIAGGQDLLGALDVQFGIPTCVMNLGRDLLSLLPTSVLGGMRNDAAVGRNAADAVTKAVSQKLRNLTGIIEFDTDEGVFRFVSDSSQYGQESGGLAGTLGSWVGAAQQAIAFGSQLYANVQAAQESIEDIVECVSGFTDYLKNIGGETAEARAAQATADPQAFANTILSEYGPQLQAAANARSFIAAADQMISDINDIISDRINNPDLEPKLVPYKGRTMSALFCFH